jgi:starch synthase
MDISLLEGIETPTTYEELAKIAIRYSDGVIVNGENISPELLEYAKSLGKPILEKQTEEAYAEACSNFYETFYDE